jgi:hypothetical protein
MMESPTPDNRKNQYTLKQIPQSACGIPDERWFVLPNVHRMHLPREYIDHIFIAIQDIFDKGVVITCNLPGVMVGSVHEVL